MYVDKELTKRVITEFLEKTFNKKVELHHTSKNNVYSCHNVDRDDAKYWKLMGEALRTKDSNILKVLDKYSSTIFVGRNYITADQDQAIAIKRLKSLNPCRDSNMFEIEFYNHYWIIYD